MKLFYRTTLTICLLLCGAGALKAQQVQVREQLSTKLSKLKSDRERRILSYRQSPRSRQRFFNEFLLVDVTPNGIPVYKAPLNENAAITAGVDKLNLGLLGATLQGKGMLVGVWDAGQVVDHIELGGRVIFREDATPHVHAAHVTGTLIATGINPAAKGMAPLAEAKSWYYDDDYEEMFNESSVDQGLIISNHSYGSITGWVRVAGVWYWTGDSAISVTEDYRFGLYGLETQIIDEIASGSPYYTIVWAAGNDRWEVGNGTNPADGNGGTGYDCIIPEAVAKNSIVVGAVDKVLNYTDASSVPMAFFSSWGPTDDGRIKPDLVGDGVNVFSLAAAPADSYTTLSGTSMSTPNVTGSLLLLQELYKKLHSNKVMRSATVKALAIHTTKESGDNPGPDYRFGWGLIDAEHAAKTLLAEDGVNVTIDELALSNGETITIPLQPVPGEKITVTMAWTDPAATAPSASLDPATLMLVNDLDMRLTDEDNNEILPWILDPANPPAAATQGDNIRDNVEKIEFDLPEDKPYALSVSHKGFLQGGSQAFSLIITHKSKLAAGKTFYWIGGTGNWRDTTHWSLTTGGPVAMELPSIADKVFVDDNSFSGVAEDTISLDSAAACRVLTWIATRKGALSMNGDTLTLSGGLTIGSDSMRTITPGIFEFKGIGELNLQNGDIENDTLTFTSGEWVINGKVKTARIRVVDGNLSMANATVSASQIIASDVAGIDMTNSAISGVSLLSFEKTFLESDEAQIVITESAILNFDNVQFNGTIRAEGDIGVWLYGDCAVDSLFLSDDIIFQIEGSDQINYLEAGAGSTLYFAADMIQHLSGVTFSGTETLPVTLGSTGLNNAVLEFADHEKICFDYLNIADVDVTGNVVVTAGVNSTISGSNGWLDVACDDVLFPQFTVDFTCAHGITEFTDTSLGNVTAWSWNFGDPASSDNTSSDEDARHQFTGPATYNVTLTVSNGNQQQEYHRQVQILPNTLDDNSILHNGHLLVSLKTAPNYQWYRNNELIEGETNKVYTFEEPGSYTVLTSDDDCNYITEPYVILGLEETLRPYRIFPVPADKQIKIIFDIKGRSHHVSIHDAMGQKIIQLVTADDESVVDVQRVKDGVYIIDADGYKAKVLVRH